MMCALVLWLSMCIESCCGFPFVTDEIESSPPLSRVLVVLFFTFSLLLAKVGCEG
jgi:hypothetical protein